MHENAACTCVIRQYELVLDKGRRCSAAKKVTTGPAESNGSLSQGIITNVNLPRDLDHLRPPTLNHE